MRPISQGCGDLPSTLRSSVDGGVATLTLARPEKSNALSDDTIRGVQRFFTELDQQVRVVVIDADGDHFCSGLDLAEMDSHDALSGVHHSRMWHRAFEAISDGPVPVVAALKGAVIGGGLELASACHLRVADESTFYALPEGQRGIFVGGGGSVRLPRLIGVARMTDMMLTGRRFDAAEGERIGLSQYVVPSGTASKTAHELARQVARNGPQTNFAVVQALPRIAESDPGDGYLMEAMMAAIAQGTDDAKARMRDFLAGRAGKVTDR